MAPFQTNHEILALLNRHAEIVQRRIEEEQTLRQAISEKQAELDALKTQLENLLTENNRTEIMFPPTPPNIAPLEMPVRSRGMTGTPAPIEPAMDVEDPETDGGAAKLPIGSDEQDAPQDQSESSDSTLYTSTPFRRNTRASLLKSGIQLGSPEKEKSMLVQLCDKKSSINILDNGKFVDTACHICGANMPRQPTKFYVNNRFDLAGLREHYRLSHKVSVDETATFQICTKTVLTGQDTADILNGREPANEMLRDRKAPDSKKDRLKAKAGADATDTSDLSAAASSNDDSIMLDTGTSAANAGIPQAGQASAVAALTASQRCGVTAETVTQAHPANYSNVNVNGNASSNASLKRKERPGAGDKENAPPAMHRRARRSGGSDAFGMGLWD